MPAKLIPPGHQSLRGVLRVVGPLLVAVGAIFLIIGIGNFFMAFGGMGPPRYFWCAFVGIPLLGVGVGLTKFAFLGVFTRYVSSEVAPVGKDTFNYLAHGTKDGVRTVSRAIFSGLRGEDGGSVEVQCTCGRRVSATARFCDACGAPMHTNKSCVACHEMNEADARFCRACGAMME